MYLYNGELKIIIENKEYDLYEAIQFNKITIQDIIATIKRINITIPPTHSIVIGKTAVQIKLLIQI